MVHQLRRYDQHENKQTKGSYKNHNTFTVILHEDKKKKKDIDIVTCLYSFTLQLQESNILLPVLKKMTIHIPHLLFF